MCLHRRSFYYEYSFKSSFIILMTVTLFSYLITAPRTLTKIFSNSGAIKYLHHISVIIMCDTHPVLYIIAVYY